MARRVLIIEGGGMKAAYANGVLTAWERAGHRPWDAVYGTSAGGALAAWYAAGQAEFAEGTWAYAADPRFMNYRRALAFRGPLLDHEALLDIVYGSEHPLDLDAVRGAPFGVHVTASDVDSGETVYPDVRQGDTLAWLKATGRLPLGSNGPVEIDGRRYLDGGCTDPIPLRHAIDAGARDVVLILNQPAGLAQRDPGLMVRLASRRYPALAGGLQQHLVRKAAAWWLARHPPEGVQVQVLQPARPTGVSRLSRDQRALRRLIAWGREDGRRFLQGHGTGQVAPDRPAARPRSPR